MNETCRTEHNINFIITQVLHMANSDKHNYDTLFTDGGRCFHFMNDISNVSAYNFL